MAIVGLKCVLGSSAERLGERHVGRRNLDLMSLDKQKEIYTSPKPRFHNFCPKRYSCWKFWELCHMSLRYRCTVYIPKSKKWTPERDIPVKQLPFSGSIGAGHQQNCVGVYRPIIRIPYYSGWDDHPEYKEFI